MCIQKCSIGIVDVGALMDLVFSATEVDLQHGGATVFHHEVQCWRNCRMSNWENVGGCLRK